MWLLLSHTSPQVTYQSCPNDPQSSSLHLRTMSGQGQQGPPELLSPESSAHLPLPTPLTTALPPPPLLHLASGEECTQDQDLQPYSSPVWRTFFQSYSSCRPPSASEHSSVLQMALWVHIWLLFQHSVPVSFLGAEAVSLLSTASF